MQFVVSQLYSHRAAKGEATSQELETENYYFTILTPTNQALERKDLPWAGLQDLIHKHPSGHRRSLSETPQGSAELASPLATGQETQLWLISKSIWWYLGS